MALYGDASSSLTRPPRTAAEQYAVALDAHLYSTAAWWGITALAAAAVVTAVGGRWGDTAVFGGFALATGAFAALRGCQPRLSSLLVVVAAMINAAGWAWGIFPTVPGYDEFAHGFTCFTFAFLLGFASCGSEGGYFRNHPRLLGAAVASVAVAAGGLWEVVELTAGVAETRADRIQDIAADAIGAAVAAPVVIWGVRRRRGAA